MDSSSCRTREQHDNTSHRDLRTYDEPCFGYTTVAMNEALGGWKNPGPCRTRGSSHQFDVFLDLFWRDISFRVLFSVLSGIQVRDSEREPDFSSAPSLDTVIKKRSASFGLYSLSHADHPIQGRSEIVNLGPHQPETTALFKPLYSSSMPSKWEGSSCRW